MKCKCKMYEYYRFPNYTDAKKTDLQKFLISLVHATYGTFKDIPAVQHDIPPEDYLEYAMSLRGEVTYAVASNSEEIVYSSELVSTVTELGSCFSYNSEIAPYSNHKSVEGTIK